ncbi:hypothetical protein [Solimonas sp. K1W22B-7]|uniref:hypothetical protein n=1 Tax=Solimonas sp. K1W22B-7 TaxID=2303331 RepID=UPI0013C462FB|nr:hypothetical protein [Solimonas sp. K1W22B-7]
MSASELLREVPRVRQVPGEAARRWFSSTTMDLIFWLDERGQPFGLQLCYDVGRRERAITWEVDRGFRHDRVESGDNVHASHSMAPILLPAGGFDRDKVLQGFERAAASLPVAVRDFVRKVLSAWPGAPAIAAARPQRGCPPAQPPAGFFSRWWEY